ncbi:MAG TPA: hypothetical protein VGC21_04345 [Telluria sp.]|jgi:hypothetical protein
MEAKNPAAPARPGPAKPKVVIEAYTFRKQGWPYIRQAGITFGVVLLLGAIVVTSVRLILLQVRPDTVAAQGRQIAATDRLAQVEMERDDLRDYQPKFVQLRARGFVGPESRLAVIEAIQAIQKNRRLLPVSFDLSPQKTVALDPALLEQPLELHSTAVRLRMDLLHEMDLVNFFQDLKGKGFFTVSECLINSAQIVVADSLAPRLNADCTLFWLTVDAAAVDPAAAPDPAAPPAPAEGIK